MYPNYRGPARGRGPLFGLSVLILSTALSQATNPKPGSSSLEKEYIRTDFTVEQGLPDNVVNAIAQGDNGLLWIGTGTGLASFDGVAFHQVRLSVEGGLPTGSVNSLLRASNGDLWVGTDAGVTILPKAAQNHVDPGSLRLLRTPQGFSDEVHALLQSHSGVVWVGGKHGLYSYSDHSLAPVLQNVYVDRLSEAADGHLFVVGNDGVVEVADGARMKPSVTAKQLGVHPDQVFDVHQGKKGVVWWGTIAGVRRQSGHLISLLRPRGVGTTTTNHIYEDSQGRIWFCTGIGLYLLDGTHLLQIDSTELPRSIYVTESGDLWLGTNGNGLVHYKPRLIRVYTKEDGLPNNQPMAVLSGADGHLLVGSNCGFSIFDGKRFRKYYEKDGLINTCVWSLANGSRQSVWIGTYGGGLFKFREGHFTQYAKAEGLADNVVEKIVVAHDNSLWIATLNGISHMEGEHFHNYGPAEGLSSDHVLDIYEDRSHVIWATSQNGLDRMVGSRFEHLSLSSTVSNGLPSRFVADGHQNVYVAGTPLGLSWLRDGGLETVLDNLNINGMIETPDRQLWCSGRNGIYRISADSLQNRRNSSDSSLDFSWINTRDGLLSSQSSVGSPNIVRSADDKLWIATVKGLAMLDLKEWPQAVRKPVVFLTGTTVDGLEVPVGEALSLAPGSHRTEIHIAAVDLDAPDTIRLQYRLEDVDQSWQNATAYRTAVYTSIPSGTHRFMVRSTDSNGRWGESVFSYDIHQQALLYERLWFRLLVATVALLLVTVLYLARVKALVKQTRVLLEERMQERERIARDLHDTFFQGIQGLLLRFNTGTAQLGQSDPARAIFEEALQQSDKVMLEGRELVLDLRSGTHQTSDLSKAFVEFALNLGRTRETNFRVLCNGTPEVLHPIVFEETYRVGKEALTNAFRHAEASEIEAELHFETSEFRLRVRDNGSGLDRSVLGSGFRQGHWGLPGMRERAHKIGGRLDIWSRKGGGTEIELRIPASVAYQDRMRSRRHWLQTFFSPETKDPRRR